MKTLAHFRQHIELHRHRVVKLGMALSKAHFPHLDIKAVESFLWLHDRSKTMTSRRQLRRHGYVHQDLPVERLFQFYGIVHRSPEQTEELRYLVRDINTVDEQIAKRYLRGVRSESKQTLRDFYHIERVSDLVDRSLDPVAAEEFGHPMILASEYIQEKELVHLSLWLEDQYAAITQELSFSRAQTANQVVRTSAS